VTSRLGSYADPMTDKIFTDDLSDAGVFGRTGLPTRHARVFAGPGDSLFCCATMVSFPSLDWRPAQPDAKANWSGKGAHLISFPSICVIYYYLQAPPRWACWFPIRCL